MLAGAHMLDFLAYEFAGLRGRRLALAFVARARSRVLRSGMIPSVLALRKRLRRMASCWRDETAHPSLGWLAYPVCSNGLPVVSAGFVAGRQFVTDSFHRRHAMSNHVYKQIELVGSSTKSTDDAIKQAIERASKPCAIWTGSRSRSAWPHQGRQGGALAGRAEDRHAPGRQRIAAPRLTVWNHAGQQGSDPASDRRKRPPGPQSAPLPGRGQVIL